MTRSETTLVLHACCGPCTIEPYDALATQYERVIVVYYNPNIHPAEEYQRRRDVLATYAHEHGIEFVELEYDPAEWHERVGVFGDDRESRCYACYQLRLSRVAQWCAQLGHPALSTTLTVSPYQDPSAISRAGESAAAPDSLTYVARDFRERYPEATRRSREMGMYRQNYCGCVFSEAEAASDRERRRAERKARKG